MMEAPTVASLQRRRMRATAVILLITLFLATFGFGLGTAVPVVGSYFFIAGLAVWAAPGYAFYLVGWEGIFRIHEFGAAPMGWGGYLAMFVFYALIAYGLSCLIFRRGKRTLHK